MSADKTFSVNWIVATEHLPQFEATAKHLGLATNIIGSSGDEIQGQMSPIEVPDNCLGISVEGVDEQNYHAELAIQLADASQKGIMPEGVVLPEGSTPKESR